MGYLLHRQNNLVLYNAYIFFQKQGIAQGASSLYLETKYFFGETSNHSNDFITTNYIFRLININNISAGFRIRALVPSHSNVICNLMTDTNGKNIYNMCQVILWNIL